MPSFLFIVRSQPHEGQRDAYNDFYNNQHLPDLLRVPGIKSARRYEVVSPPDAAWKDTFLAIYEVEADNPAFVTDEIARRYGTDIMPRNPIAVDSSKTISIWATPIGPARTASG